MKLCSPEGQSRPLSLGAAARPRKLDGLRIGLLDNTKAPVDNMLVHISGRLRQRFPGVEIYSASKKLASLPAEVEIIQDLRNNADILINALGD